MKQKKLYRSRHEKILFGVCGGLSELLHLDPTLVRIITVLVGFSHFLGIVLYLVLALILPEDPRPAVMDTPIENALNISMEEDHGKKEHVFLGWIIIGIGFLFLLEQLGWLSRIHWNLIWPFVLIIIGACLLASKK